MASTALILVVNEPGMSVRHLGLLKHLDGRRVGTNIIRVSFLDKNVRETLPRLMNLMRPRLALLIAPSMGKAHLVVELLAKNGSEQGEFIPGGPAVLSARFPNTDVIDALRAAAMPTAVSRDAGGKIAEQAFYIALHSLGSSRVGMIRVPTSPIATGSSATVDHERRVLGMALIALLSSSMTARRATSKSIVKRAAQNLLPFMELMNSFESGSRGDLAYRGPFGVAPVHGQSGDDTDWNARGIEDIQDFNMNWLPYDDPERDKTKRIERENIERSYDVDDIGFYAPSYDLAPSSFDGWSLYKNDNSGRY